MKKGLGIVLVLALAVMLVPSAVFAADPCDVVIQWAGGAGLTQGTVTAGSTLATTQFTVLGNNINGQFEAHYTGIGGGPYGGASYNSKMNTSLNDGAIEYQTLRGAFGYTNGSALEPGGFSSYSFVGAGTWGSGGFTTGTGAVSMKTGTKTDAPITTHTGVNTSLIDNTYGWVGTTAHNFQVTGASAFSIIRALNGANSDFARVDAVGTGDAYLDNIYSVAGRPHNYQMVGGPGPGYDFSWGQDFGANNGSGLLSINGMSHNSVLLPDLTATGANPATSSFASTGVLSIVGSGLQATGTGALNSCSISQNVGWNSTTYGAFTYNKAIMKSQ